MTDKAIDAQSSRPIKRKSFAPDMEPPAKRPRHTYLKPAGPLLAMSRSIMGMRLIRDASSDSSSDSESEQDLQISMSAIDEDADTAEDSNDITYLANIEDPKDGDDDANHITKGMISKTGANASSLRRPRGRPRGSGEAKEPEIKDSSQQGPRQHGRDRKGRFARRSYR